jgi:hypothetical protein
LGETYEFVFHALSLSLSHEKEYIDQNITLEEALVNTRG